MVVKNESARIGACLNSVKDPLVDEIVVVDTGSTDRTKDIARIFGSTRI
jgi:glycosyltransferase involved in cell wall biosynthesis